MRVHNVLRHAGAGAEAALRRPSGVHYRPRSGRPVLHRVSAFALALALLVGYAPALTSLASAAAGDPVVTREDGTNGCNGVRPTPGSENTSKRLDPDYPSDLSPGGSVGYIIDYPVDPADVAGRETFVITDCIFVNGAAAAKYSVSFVPNTAAYELRFAIPVPAGTPLGSEFCNYAKTTAAPSASPASNRKAGPACFTVGGSLRIEKRSGSATGPLLPGATFDVSCEPATDQPPTIITGLSAASHTNPDSTVSATGTSASGTIAIVGPSGTPCTVTETAAPDGYTPDTTPRALIIPVGAAQTIEVFVNRQYASLSVIKTTSGGTGIFTFTLDCDEDNFDGTFQIDTNGTHTVPEMPIGAQCTVTETPDARFTSTVDPAGGTVTIDRDGETVTFANTRKVADLVISKTTTGGTGTFVFDVDCAGVRYSVEITDSGKATVSDIPTGTSCSVTERPNAEFTSTSVPADGKVTVDDDGAEVAFTNTAKPAALAVAKTADRSAVDAGQAIGFTVTVTNNGTGTARNASLNDPLPAGAGIEWSISPAYAGPGSCAIAGAVPTQTLACSFGDLAPAASASVHVASATTAATSGSFTNTATAKADNSPAVEASAAVGVIRAAVADVVIVRPAEAAPAPVAVAPATLPRTGVDTDLQVRAAVVLLVLGGLALVPEHLRRRRQGAVRIEG